MQRRHFLQCAAATPLAGALPGLASAATTYSAADGWRT